MNRHPDIKNEYSCLILAGGKSSRMGHNKATLKWNGISFLDHIIFKIRCAGIQTILISGQGYEEKPFESVKDLYPERGPLGGIHAGLKKIQTPYCFVLPVDVPGIPVFVLEELIEYHHLVLMSEPSCNPVVLWEHGDRKEPLIGIYPVEMADRIGELIEEGPAPVFRMLDRWPYLCHRIEINKDMIVNINTRAKYRKLKEMEYEQAIGFDL